MAGVEADPPVPSRDPSESAGPRPSLRFVYTNVIPHVLCFAIVAGVVSLRAPAEFQFVLSYVAAVAFFDVALLHYRWRTEFSRPPHVA